MAKPIPEQLSDEPSWFSFALAWIGLLACIILPLTMGVICIMFFANPMVGNWSIMTWQILCTGCGLIAMASVGLRLCGRRGFEPRLIHKWANAIEPLIERIDRLMK